MLNKEFIEILKNELPHEYENEIDKVLVFYKNGEKLKISTEDNEIKVDKTPLPEEDNNWDYYDNPEYADQQAEIAVAAEAEAEAAAGQTAGLTPLKSQAETDKANVLGYNSTQMIQLPTGRRINIIN